MAVVHAAQILSAFGASRRALSLSAIAARVTVEKATVFRHLHTLERCGLIQKVSKGRYRRCGTQFYITRSATELSNIANINSRVCASDDSPANPARLA